MSAKVSQFIRSCYARLAKAGLAWSFLLLTMLGFAAFGILDRGRPAGSPGIVALQLAFSKEAFQRVITQWGPVGVRLYQQSTLGLDFFFPIAYALCLSSWIAWLSLTPGREPGRGLVTLFTLPWLAAVLDWIENISHLVLLRDVQHLSAPLVLIASTAAAIKWGLIAFSAGAIAYFIVRRARRSASRG